MSALARLDAHVTGEMAVGDVPLSQGVTEETIRNIQGDDTDPMQVVIAIGPGEGGRGWQYGEDVLRKLVDHVQAKTLNGFLGHQREEDLATQFPTPVSHWVGAKWQGGKAYFRGVMDPTAGDLKRWIRAGRITAPSIFTKPTLKGKVVTDLEPLSIDWAPLHRQGMQTASVVGWGEMSADVDVVRPPAEGKPGILIGNMLYPVVAGEQQQEAQSYWPGLTIRSVPSFTAPEHGHHGPQVLGEMSSVWKSNDPPALTTADLGDYFSLGGADRR